MRSCCLLAVILGIAVGSNAVAQSQSVREQMQKEPDFRVYSVIFGVTLDSATNVVHFRVSKVIDPKSGSTAAVNVPVPGVYVAQARKKFASKPGQPKMLDGRPVEFFTYYFYTPADPGIVITDLDAPINKQE